jgi:signal transduction histidine kinase
MGMFGVVYWRTSSLLFRTLDRSVMEQLSLLSARPPELLSFMIASRMNQQPAVVTLVGLFDHQGNLIVGDVTEIPPGLALDSRIHEVVIASNPPVHWRAAGRVLPDRRTLIVARPSDEILEVNGGLVRDAAAAIVPTVLLSLALGVLVGVGTEARLRRLSSVAERIIAGELGERLPARPHGDELDRLCAIVNRMLDRLEEGIEALRGAGENIAHDVRTPLTGLRARLERLAARTDHAPEVSAGIEKSIAGVDQALAIVTALLRIADIRHVRRTSAFAPVDLAALVAETAESYLPVAEDKGVRLTCATSSAIAVHGDRQLLAEAAVNLVDNAVKFTPAGGEVVISLHGPPDRPVISVTDTGPGIPEEARPVVFRRFYRAETSRSTAGSGLGLSLVAAIMGLHGFAARVVETQCGCRIDLLCWKHEQAPVSVGARR